MSTREKAEKSDDQVLIPFKPGKYEKLKQVILNGVMSPCLASPALGTRGMVSSEQCPRCCGEGLGHQLSRVSPGHPKGAQIQKQQPQLGWEGMVCGPRPGTLGERTPLGFQQRSLSSQQLLVSMSRERKLSVDPGAMLGFAQGPPVCNPAVCLA